MELLRIHMEEHIIQGQTERDGTSFAVKHTGVAMPALFPIGYGRDSLRCFLAEDLHRTDGSADSTSNTFFGIDFGRHNFLLEKELTYTHH